MKSRLCCPRPMRRSIASALRPALTALALCGWGVADAASAPAWMHALTGTPDPQHDEKTDSVLLYAESNVTVLPNGTFKRLDRLAYRILRPGGDARGLVRIDFDTATRITDLRAWCIPASGKDYEVKMKDAVESAIPGIDGSTLISDARSLLMRIPAATPGNIVGYEVAREQRPYVLADEWNFQDTVPVGEARYTLALPPGWSYKATWLNHPEVAPTAPAAGISQWAVKDVREVAVESSMPPWQGIAARLFVSIRPPDGKDRGFESWHEMGVWYQRLTDGRRAASSEIRQKVAELTSGLPTTMAKMLVLAAFVQNDIRYVAIELGIGGMQPHPATEVFANRFGDCKDKVTLLATMLKEIGVEAHYVIINTNRGSVTASTPPNLGFNHMIVAIVLPPGPDGGSQLAQATLPKLGKVLYFDPTDPLTPFGRLPGPLQANFGLLVTPEGGVPVPMPQAPVASNSIVRTAKLVLDENGAVRGDVHEIWTGDMAASQRYALRAVERNGDEIRNVESLLSHSLTTFHIVRADVLNPASIGMPVEWSYSFEAPQYAKLTGALLLVRPRVIGTRASGMLETREPRRNPIEFESLEKDTDLFEITLPAGYSVDELPPPVNVDYGFATYQSTTEIAGRTLRYRRSYEIRDLSVPVSKAGDLRDLYRIIANDERMSAVLTRAP